MRYVGLTVLAILYWTNAVLLHMVLADPCLWSAIDVGARDARTGTPAPVTMPAPTVSSLVDDWPSRMHHHGEDRVVDSDQSLDAPLSKVAVVAGMNSVRPRIHACYARFQVPGTAIVNITISKSGRVVKAETTGYFAGTPTGACVEAAVKTAGFPPSAGFATPYPFQLK